MFHYYKSGINNKVPSNIMTIQQFVKLLRHDEIKQQVLKVRDDKTLKTRLPYVTFGGMFTTRGSNNLIEASGLLTLDLDNVNNLEEIKAKISKDPYTHLVFTSPSGNGLKVIVKIPKVHSDHEYKEFMAAVVDHYKLPIDESGKDISRACFISYDDKPYFNESSSVFTSKVVLEKSFSFIQYDTKLIDLMADVWKEGVRQSLAVYLVAVLRQKGYGVVTIEGILRQICHVAQDLDVNERLTAIKTTFEKNVDEIKGYSGLKALLNEEIFTKVKNALYEDIEPVEENKQLEGLNFLDVIDGDFAPLSWRIPGVIMDKGSFTFLAGEGGKFKTYLSMFMIRSLLTGEPFLDHTDIKKSRVLYIDEESGRRRMKVRLNKVMKDYKNKVNPDDFKLYDFTNKFKFDDEGMLHLEQVIRDFRPDVVFMDSLTRLFMGKENSADETKVILNYLKNLYNKYECAFVLIHHFNKNAEATTRLRGSSELIAAPDVIVIVEEEAVNQYKFYHEKLRDGLKDEVRHFEVTDLPDERIEISLTKKSSLGIKSNAFDIAKTKIKNYIFDNCETGDIIKSSTLVEDGICSRNTVKKLMDALEREKIVKIEKQGEYKVIYDRSQPIEVSEF